MFIAGGILVALLLVTTAVVFTNRLFSTESQTTKIGFEDIGEFATQSSHAVEVNLTDSSHRFLDFNLPFTNTKYIYSYAVTIKAGYNFKEIEWSKNDELKTIEVKLPEVKILSTELDRNSFKVYHEDESIFNRVSLAENNQAISEMEIRAQEDSIANGLFDNARKNAEIMLTSFFGSVYDLNVWKIEFRDK